MQLLCQTSTVEEVSCHYLKAAGLAKTTTASNNWSALMRMLDFSLPPCNNFRCPGLPQLSFEFPLCRLKELLKIQPLCFLIFLGLQDHLQLHAQGDYGQEAFGVSFPASGSHDADAHKRSNVVYKQAIAYLVKVLYEESLGCLPFLVLLKKILDFFSCVNATPSTTPNSSMPEPHVQESRQ